MGSLLCIGDNAVDIYPQIRRGFLGGQALNVAYFGKLWGAETAYMGVIGTDFLGDFVKTSCDDLQIDCSHSKIVQGDNCYSTVQVIDGERHFGADNRGGVSRLFPLCLSEEDARYVAGFDLVHMTRDSFVDHLISQVSSLGVPLSYDFSENFTNLRLEQICPHLTVAIFSVDDLPMPKLHQLLGRAIDLGANMALATRGKLGSVFYDGRHLVQFGILPCQVVDTLGAGDSFAAGALCQLSQFLKEGTVIDERHQLEVLKSGAAMAVHALEHQGGIGKEIKLPKNWTFKGV